MKFTHLNGVFPVYKPKGITSAQYLEFIKHKLRQFKSHPYDYQEITPNNPIKMGHGGTIDRSASGVLVVGINKGTSKLPAFLNGNKAYTVSAFFGKSTDTYNSEGTPLIQSKYDHITEKMIAEALSTFHGRTLQRPPVYSALKHRGYRLSDLTRKGIKIKPEPRPVNCYGTSILDFQSPELTFSVACGGGFYVRSLVHDLGLMLSSCAHVVDLERTRQGPFTLEHCLLEDELTPATVGKQIDILRPLLEVYLDQAMAEFREGKLIKQEIIGNSPPS